MIKHIAIACDHAGVEYKNKLIDYLKSCGYIIENLGTDTTDAVDYPLYADKVCKSITTGTADIGILICGTGIGMSIAANKHYGIRAAVCGDIKSANFSREHNDANVLCLGARIISYTLAEEITHSFLSGEFIGGKHQIRVNMLESEE